MSDKTQSDLDLGRDKLTSYESWPPPRPVLEYLNVFVDLTDTLLDDGKILDLGCGDGSIDILLAQKNSKKKITAVDLEAHSQWAIARAKNLEFKAESLYDLPFKSKSFDSVVMKDVLHHLDDPEQVILDVIKLAKKQVLIIEANRYNPISYVRMVKIAKHEHFSYRKIKKLTGKNANITTIETHVWPKKLKKVGKLSDTAFNKLPFLRRLRNYNIILIEPED